jgi:glutamate/tyrosine decarboxylase-like PLP-dependent enzyme
VVPHQADKISVIRIEEIERLDNMETTSTFLLNAHEREEVWTYLSTVVEDYLTSVDTMRVAPQLSLERIQSLLNPFNFERPLQLLEVLNAIVQGLWEHQVQTPHPRYFGLFNPAPTTMSIVADTLVAAFNPQLAAWSHSPLANEIEQLLVRLLGERFGYDPTQADGTFASGGAEANHTALLTALVHAFPEFAQAGLRALAAQPVFYVTGQSHHSFIKAARFCGLGTEAVRVVPVNEKLQMDVDRLTAQVNQDRRSGYAPFMVVATAGTTNAGVIDPLEAVAQVAAAADLWFHADAAWGGAAALVPELRPLLAGIEQADSITFDAHKWLSVPMGAGLYLTRHADILAQTCGITTGYMPRDAAGLEVVDPYTHSLQWSRRFIGLKLFLSLAVAGWAGYETIIRYQVTMGDLLRQELEQAGWQVVNQTRLPVVCFVDRRSPAGATAPYLEAIAGEVVSSGQAWLSTTWLDEVTPVLRACITNYRTAAIDVVALVQALDEARQRIDPAAVNQ